MSNKFNKDVAKSAGTVDSAGHTPLRKLAEKSNGDRMVYYDPEGWSTPQGEPINLREKFYEEGNWEEKFEKINEALQYGDDAREAVRAGLQAAEKQTDEEKSLNTTRVSMPVYVRPEIFITDQHDTPLSDGLRREAVSTTEVKLDEVTDVGTLSGVTAEGNDYPEVDSTISQYEYSIHQVGLRKVLSDLIINTDRYNPEQLATENGAEAISVYKETQAIQGTSFDANGFAGLRDHVETAKLHDAAGSQLTPAEVREVVQDITKTGADEEDLMVVASHGAYFDLKSNLNDYQRFQQPQTTWSFGAQALKIDGVMVSKSHGCPDDTDGAREVWALDATAHSWLFLADTTVKPVAATASSTEEMVIYEHVGFGSEGKTRIAGYENLA